MPQPKPPPIWQTNAKTLTEFAQNFFCPNATVFWCRSRRKWYIDDKTLRETVIGYDKFQARCYLISILEDTWLIDQAQQQLNETK